MARYSITSVSLSPPHFKWATIRMRLRASLHCVFSTLMCFLNERCESHHSPRNFVGSSTGRSVFPILTMGGLWARDRGAVKCMTALVGCKPEAIPVWHSLPDVDVSLWCPESVLENRSPGHRQRYSGEQQRWSQSPNQIKIILTHWVTDPLHWPAVYDKFCSAWFIPA